METFASSAPAGALPATNRDILAESREIEASVQGVTLCSAFATTADNAPDLAAIRWEADGDWREVTWAQYRAAVRSTALGLRVAGFGAGQFGLIMARNRPEHVIADLAIVHAGGVPVSLYNTFSAEQIAYVANHCEATLAVVEAGSPMERFHTARHLLPHIKTVVVIGGDSGGADPRFDELGARGDDVATGEELFEEMASSVQPGHAATVIYTSGTTGPPKGVVISHRNIAWAAASYARALPPFPAERAISYLPLAHAAERATTHWFSIFRGQTVTYCPDGAELGRYLRQVRPHIFLGVPRVWEKLQAGILTAIAAEPDRDTRERLVEACRIGERTVDLEQRGEVIPAELSEALVRSASQLVFLRHHIGLDEVRAPVTGAAPMNPAVARFFHAIGVRVSDCWGMTESTALGTWSGIDRIKIGRSGPPWPGVESRLGDDGELLIRGGNVISGYFKDPEQTAQLIDGDGWLHSGDIATVDDDGYYAIVDRKKELIITASGKNVAPTNLESKLKCHPLIGQAVVIGDRRPYLVALVVLDGEVAPGWAASAGIVETSLEDLARSAPVEDEIRRAVDEVNAVVSNPEQIRAFRILPIEWTAESEELTPTLKLKRRVITQRYRDLIASMYGEDAASSASDAT